MRISDWSSDVCSSDLALRATCADLATWRLISAIEEESSSAALETVCTFVEACSEAAATAIAWRDVCSAVAVMEVAVGCNSVRSEEHTSELQSLMRISNAVFFLKKTHG